MKSPLTAAVVAVVVGSVTMLVGVAHADPNVCVSVDGVLRVDTGSTECRSIAGHNVAVAVNGESEAQAFPGHHNVAISVNGVDEDDSYFAGAKFGDHNTAVAVNGSESCSGGTPGPQGEFADWNKAVSVNDSNACASEGEGNQAIAINGSQAGAGDGDDNSATAINDSCAVAEGSDGETEVVVNDPDSC
jgi:hypothetical protein